MRCVDYNLDLRQVNYLSPPEDFSGCAKRDAVASLGYAQPQLLLLLLPLPFSFYLEFQISNFGNDSCIVKVGIRFIGWAFLTLNVPLPTNLASGQNENPRAQFK